jgi:hypothetical protein
LEDPYEQTVAGHEQEIMKDIYHKSIKAANDYGFSKGNPQ